MVYKVFLDANILLDFFLKRDATSSSKDIIQAATDGRIRAFISPAIVHIVAYWLTKSYGSGKAKELLLSLLADVRIIEINHEVALNAINSRMTDIEDALQYYIAIHHKLDYFITNDKPLKKMAIPVLPVYTPQEFIKELL